MELTVDISCPNCNLTHKIKVKEMYPGNSTLCSCGTRIRFEGGDGRQVQDKLDALQNSLHKLSSKTITIKL